MTLHLFFAVTVAALHVWTTVAPIIAQLAAIAGLIQ